MMELPQKCQVFQKTGNGKCNGKGYAKCHRGNIAYAKASAINAGCYRMIRQPKSINIDINYIIHCHMNRVLLVILITTFSLGTVSAQKLPKKKATLATLRLANKYF